MDKIGRIHIKIIKRKADTIPMRFSKYLMHFVGLKC